MKRFWGLLYVLCFFVPALKAQDTLVKRNGERIVVKVLEINPDDIRYKRFANLDGPLYSIYKTEVRYITYASGLKENYENVLPPKAPETVIIQAAASPLKDLTIQPDGKLYRYKDRLISEQEMFEIINKEKDPQLHLLVQQTQVRKTAQYAFCAGGWILGFAGNVVLVDLVNNQSARNQSAQDQQTQVKAGIILFQLGLACEITSLSFKIERRMHTHALLDAYNGKVH
jgi:hypothetical protein